MRITEALAEVKTLLKRIEKKREFVLAYLVREERLRDPLEKDGGSAKALAEALQSIRDLQERVVAIRLAILTTNLDTDVKVGEGTRSIFGWLTWRKEVAPGQRAFLQQLFTKLSQVRAAAAREQRGVINVEQKVGDSKPTDIIVNISEGQLAKEIEGLEQTLGVLDGQLSMVNATTDVQE